MDKKECAIFYMMISLLCGVLWGLLAGFVTGNMIVALITFVISVFGVFAFLSMAYSAGHRKPDQLD